MSSDSSVETSTTTHATDNTADIGVATSTVVKPSALTQAQDASVCIELETKSHQTPVVDHHTTTSAHATAHTAHTQDAHSGHPQHHGLQHTRETKEWTIEQVADQLKIRTTQVVAMESGDWQNICPDPAFAQSYLRNYIQLLGLPVEATLKVYGELNERPNSIHSVNTVGTSLTVQNKTWHLPRSWRWVVGVVVGLVIIWQVFTQWSPVFWLGE